MCVCSGAQVYVLGVCVSVCVCPCTFTRVRGRQRSVLGDAALAATGTGAQEWSKGLAESEAGGRSGRP